MKSYTIDEAVETIVALPPEEATNFIRQLKTNLGHEGVLPIVKKLIKEYPELFEVLCKIVVQKQEDAKKEKYPNATINF